MPYAVLRSPGASRFVGRGDELGALCEALATSPSVAFVEGEAGIGKTRLIDEALGRPAAAGRRVLVGTCLPLREPFPYGPVVDLFRGLAEELPSRLNPVCGALRGYLPELAAALPPAPEPSADHRATRHRLFRAVRALLEALGDTVVVVEDVHWADDGTRDLLRFLVNAPPARLTLVLSYRREDLPDGGLPLGRAHRCPPGTTEVRIPLHPLDADAVCDLTAAMTGGLPVSAEVAAELHRRTAGIPFVLEETVRVLAAGSRTQRWLDLDAIEAMRVPALLLEATADRMAQLSPAAADAVRAAAVLRVPAEEELIAELIGEEGTEGGRARNGSPAPARPAPGGTPVPPRGRHAAAAALREALLAGVLHETEGGRYGFRHTLAQQAVYSMLPGPDRHQLHRRALSALSRRDPPPLVRLAYHARLSGDWAAWHRHCEQAVDAAHAMGDTALVVELLEELLCDDQLPTRERGRLAARLSREAAVGLAHRRATGLLRRVLRDTSLPEGLRGEIRLNLGLLLNNQAGRYQEGRADTATAVAELRDRPALAARGMAALAMPSWGDQPLQVYEKWIARAEELVAAQQDGALRIAVRGNHLTLLMSTGAPGVWEQAGELLAQGRSVAERREVARACGNLADAATCLGHYEAARRFRLEGRRLAAECGAPYLESIVEGTALRLAWYTGEWDGLAERAHCALGMVGGVSGIAADAHLVLGLLASARGEWEEAQTRLRDAGPADPANAPANILAAASAALARLRMACGDPEAACAEALRAVARIREKGIWTWAADLMPRAVEALVRCARHDEAAALTAEFARWLAGRDTPLAAAAHRACQGVLATAAGRHTEAAAAFDTARDAYAALPQPYSAARTGEAAARNRLAAGEASGAAQLACCAEEFAALGAIRDAARCRSALRQSGTRLPSRRGRRGYGGALSPREREVARLVALGRTNRQIAEVLFLSPRTVEQHVARVLRKLNVASRAEVAALSPAALEPPGPAPGAPGPSRTGADGAREER
ncbi:AAA family ATPase [Streptomyces albus subsp. chlorinus]|uniref:AAA family ATPase n=1 Tax=Streptomyces albus TaxID=1888 RepID=UPI0015710AAD|nr:AAA family ATPase [Streptomyces albus subsp. chlorinus]